MENYKTVIAVSTGLISANLKPGETFEGEFFVINPESDGSESTYSVEVGSLTYEDEFYNASFDDPTDYNQIMDWTEIENPKGTLASGEKRAVKFKIAVPEDAPAGGQYMSLLVSEGEKSEETSPENLAVRSRSRIAVLFYATVEGETREEGAVLENNVSAFYFNQPIKTSSLVENTGNVHLPAVYTLRVFPLFGNEEIYSNDEAPVKSSVIPGTIFYSEKTWEETPRLGLFRVQQDIDFGDHIDRRESLAFVAPTWFLILLAIFLASIIYAIIERLRKRKKSS